MAPGLANDLARESGNLARDPGMRGVFFADGEVLAAGQTLRQPHLARSLALIGSDGPAAMYGGEVGASLVKLLAAGGSAMTEEDFAAHTVELSQALAAEYDGVEYLSTGANSQGLYFLQGLRALDVARSVRGPLDPLGRDAGVVASVLAWTAGDRDRHCADPDWSSAPSTTCCPTRTRGASPSMPCRARRSTCSRSARHPVTPSRWSWPTRTAPGSA